MQCSWGALKQGQRHLNKNAFLEFMLDSFPQAPTAAESQSSWCIAPHPSHHLLGDPRVFISHLAKRPTFCVLLRFVVRARVEPGSGAWINGCLGLALLEFPHILLTVYFNSEYINISCPKCYLSKTMTFWLGNQWHHCILTYCVKPDSESFSRWHPSPFLLLSLQTDISCQDPSKQRFSEVKRAPVHSHFLRIQGYF